MCTLVFQNIIYINKLCTSNHNVKNLSYVEKYNCNLLFLYHCYIYIYIYIYIHTHSVSNLDHDNSFLLLWIQVRVFRGLFSQVVLTHTNRRCSLETVEHNKELKTATRSFDQSGRVISLLCQKEWLNGFIMTAITSLFWSDSTTPWMRRTNSIRILGSVTSITKLIAPSFNQHQYKLLFFSYSLR